MTLSARSPAMGAVRHVKITIALLLSLTVTGSLAAQTRPTTAAKEATVTVRPFFLAAGEELAADKTFDAVLGSQSLRSFWGGGVQLGFHRGFFVEVALSRFGATGQRAFVANGQAVRLGIPLTTAITPFEVTGGYRYKLSRVVSPYIGFGVGRYWYSETSEFNTSDENIAESHAGLVVMGGAEFRVQRWVAVGVDAHYTHVPGILGDAGVSQAFNEKDLGGTAVRVRILVGR